MSKKLPKSVLGKLLYIIIRLYQLIISPIIHLIPNSGCRFYPTCSAYMIDAINKHGAIKGFILGVCRIIRCNPLCKGGLDYVPKNFKWSEIFKQNGVDEFKK